MNKITVVITTFNGASYLNQQIDSLLAQTLLPEEIIICDDCSTDKTVQIIQGYLENPIFRFYNNITRLGVIENFKKGVSLASLGNYIALCDQDDIWLPQKLEKSAIALAKIEDANKPAMIYSDLILVDAEGGILNQSVRNETGQDKYRHCFKTLLFGNFVTGCTILMNAEMAAIFRKIPNNPHFKHDAWIALVAFSFGKVYSLDQAYILYRKHDQNVTFSKHQKTRRIQRLKNHLVFLLRKNNYLESQFILINLFYEEYKASLSIEKKEIIMKFLSLEKYSYLRKKIYFEKIFAGKWLHRF